ncbi:MAG: DUF1415 domain-containing protein [Bacteroidetes bacterium]|nr:MAG: DUF1415 domain-containing protein [Bacteroidota bacterium]
MKQSEYIIAQTRRWVESFVVGLNLCPFAANPLRQGKVRFALSQAQGVADLLQDLAAELSHLAQTPPEQVETTLLIHPEVLQDFADYNDFLDLAEALLVDMDLEGVIQIASFHPHYHFAGTDAHAPENATNRSPYPMLHLLREDSVEAAVASHPDVASIPQRNIALLRKRSSQRGGEEEAS